MKTTSNGQNQQRQVTQTNLSSAAKKPYQKPEVRFERVFETMALACGKVQGTGGPCRFNRKSS